MYRAAEITLLTEARIAHGIHEAPTITERQVFATVSSLSEREREQARSMGLAPEIVFVLRLQDDYQNEKKILWQGEEYLVSFVNTSGDMLRLTAERSNHADSV